MIKGRQTKDEQRAREIKSYTDSHGGPELCNQGDRLTCLCCAAEVNIDSEKCPGCGNKIDWAKYIVPFGKHNYLENIRSFEIKGKTFYVSNHPE